MQIEPRDTNCCRQKGRWGGGQDQHGSWGLLVRRLEGGELDAKEEREDGWYWRRLGRKKKKT